LVRLLCIQRDSAQPGKRQLPAKPRVSAPGCPQGKKDRASARRAAHRAKKTARQRRLPQAKKTARQRRLLPQAKKNRASAPPAAGKPPRAAQKAGPLRAKPQWNGAKSSR